MTIPTPPSSQQGLAGPSSTVSSRRSSMEIDGPTDGQHHHLQQQQHQSVTESAPHSGNNNHRSIGNHLRIFDSTTNDNHHHHPHDHEDTAALLPHSVPSSTVARSRYQPATNANTNVKNVTPLCSPDVQEGDSAQVRHWKRSRYAVGLVETTWKEEMTSRQYRAHTKRRAANSKDRCCCATLCAKCSSHNHVGCCEVCCDACREDDDPSCCCLILTSKICPFFGAKRIGNMVVLKERMHLTMGQDNDDEDDEEDDCTVGEDEESRSSSGGGGAASRKYKHEFVFVLGPYWPILFGLTYPLVYGVSFMTAWKALPKKSPFIIGVWAVFTGILCVSLFNVSCRDPGIMKRRRKNPMAPPNADGSVNAGAGPGAGGGMGGALSGRQWKWNDQALTFRPRGAIYDTDCACVIEEYDHVCPWTGTAIGKKNMNAFKGFVSCIFICLIFDILLLTGAV